MPPNPSKGAGAYNDTQVGTDKLITVSYALSGGDAGNYLPPANITVQTGVITAKQLTISAPTLTNSKV
ncbi:YDG domain-containing protein [Paenibacillus sp. HWE-109]|uniref:YDG domain-containing protein n=1 Tax=Paenibacillus sp. HWE-109 TaxID=1306526 RepID=UPI00308067BC